VKYVPLKYAHDMSEERRGSAVGIATGCGLDDCEVGVRVLVRSRIFTSPYRPDPLRAHPASYPVGTEGSPPTSTEVKRTWIYKSTPPILLLGAVVSLLSKGTTVLIFSFDDSRPWGLLSL
jgi:hypothetical protein